MKSLPNPNILKSQGVKVSGDVFKIRDDMPPAPKKKPILPDDTAAGLTDESGFAFEPEEQDGGHYGDDAMHPVQAEIIQGAMAEASRILEEAVKNAEVARAEIVAKAKYEADRQSQEILESARRQGFASVVGEIQQTANLLQDVIARLEGDKAGFEAEFEQNLKWFSVEIASKVLAKKVSEDDSILLDMVAKAAKSVQNEPWIRIEVAQEMTGLLEQLLRVFDNNTKVQVNSAPLEPGAIQIETPSGVIDASLRTQLANLKTYFEQSQNEHQLNG